MTEPEQRRARRKRRWPWALAAVAGLVALTVASLPLKSAESQPAKPQEAVGNEDKVPPGQDPAVYWQRKVEEKLAAYRAKGEPVTWEELLAAREKLPPDQNSALAFQKAFEELEPLNPGSEVTLWLADRARWGVACSPQSLDLSVRYLDRFKDVFASLQRAGRLAHGVYPLSYAPPMPPDSGEYIHGLRESAWDLALAASFDMQRGKGADAAAKLLAIRRLSASLGDCWLLTEALARVGLDARLVNTLEDCLSVGVMPAKDLATLSAELATEEDEANPRHVFYGERATCNAGFRLDSLQRGLSQPGRASEEEWHCYVTLDRMAEIAALPPQQTAQVIAELPEKEAKTADELKQPGALARQMTPSWRRFLEEEIRNVARLRVARAALAVEQFRLAHGKWPDTLEATVPAFIEAVPIDPYSGKPIVYRQTEEGPVLYSVGPNGRDDGGQASDPRTGDILDIPFRLSQGDERPMHMTTFREEYLPLSTLRKMGMTEADLRKAGVTEEDIKYLEDEERFTRPGTVVIQAPTQDKGK